ncbi:MAG: hypothetical protein IJ825_04555 [Oscillospiraceae bacterium]|nr:hypothetical protein [Oscillospiraceae bacterium]
MAETGRKLTLVLAVYLVVKDGINLVLGSFSVNTWISLAISVALACVLYFGVKPSNYIAAGILTVLVMYYLPGNLRTLPGSAVYLFEGMGDLICAGLLCLHPGIRMFFDSDHSQN